MRMLGAIAVVCGTVNYVRVGVQSGRLVGLGGTLKGTIEKEQ